MTVANPLELRSAMQVLARQDFLTFAQLAFSRLNGETYMDNWHIAAIVRQLDRIYEGEIKRLIITMPPRSLKSYLVNICFPAWLLGCNPAMRIICASYVQALANDFSRDMRRLMTSGWYRGVFPNTHLDPSRSSLEEIGTTRGGYRISTSVGGTLTGRGADLIIADDPMSASDAHSETMRERVLNWYNTTLSSRLNNPKKGAIITVGQRLHMHDLPGHLLDAGGWEHLTLPMIEWQARKVELLRGKVANRAAGSLLHVKRIGQIEIDRIRHEMGERDFEAQYNQRPLPPGGALFKQEWIKRYAKPLPHHHFRGIFQSWDTGYEIQNDNDYSVCTTWGVLDGQFHLLDVYRARLPFYALEKKVVEHRKQWRAQLVIIEKQGAGISLFQNIALSDEQHWLKPLIPQKSKQDRASQQTPKFERGMVFLPETADWLGVFEKELLSFPHGKHDDQVDSAIQFLTAFDFGRLFILADIARQHTQGG